MLKIAQMASLVLPVKAEPLPLRLAVRDACGRDYRRVNRFIELALLGAAQIRNASLPATTSLMLSSDTGMWADTARVIEGMVVAGRVPKPFEFMNLSGSMAGFHVADLLGLRGPQIGLQKNHSCFESALPLVLAERSPQCVLGVVEEACWPLADMRERLEWQQGELLECSHWLHFDPQCAAPIAELGLLPIMRSHRELADYFSSLSATPRWISAVAFSRTQRPNWLTYPDHFSWFGAENARARHSCGLTLQTLCQFAESHAGQSLIHVNQTGQQEFHVLELTVAPRPSHPQICFSI